MFFKSFSDAQLGLGISDGDYPGMLLPTHVQLRWKKLTLSTYLQFTIPLQHRVCAIQISVHWDDFFLTFDCQGYPRNEAELQPRAIFWLVPSYSADPWIHQAWTFSAIISWS